MEITTTVQDRGLGTPTTPENMQFPPADILHPKIQANIQYHAL